MTSAHHEVVSTKWTLPRRRTRLGRSRHAHDVGYVADIGEHATRRSNSSRDLGHVCRCDVICLPGLIVTSMTMAQDIVTHEKVHFW